MEDTEKRKVKEMMREKESAPAMDWMYKGEKPSEEDYLLGKRVDRHVETKDEPPQPDDIFGERIKANIALDMAAKAREDPLFAIRKREEEAKKRLLENPIKMKMLKKSLEKQQKRENKKKKKHKHSEEDDIMQKYLSILNKKQTGKHDKPKHSDSHRKHSNDSDDSDSDRPARKQDFPRKKHRQDFDDQRTKHSKSRADFHIRNKHQRDSDSDSNSRHKSSFRKGEKLHRNRHDSDSDKTDGRKGSKDKRNKVSDKRNESDHFSSKHRKEQPHPGRHSVSEKGRQPSSDDWSTSDSSDSSDDSSEDNQRYKGKKYGLIVNKNKIKTEADRKSEKSRAPSPPHRSRSPVSHRRSRSPRRRSRSPRGRSRTPDTRKPSKYGDKDRRRQTPPRKLTSEEKKRKVEEMMSNATWREDKRKQNVSRYREEEEQEALRHKQDTKDDKFINTMMSSHAEKSSVADRIKRNKYNIQRTKADMNKDFLKK
ncbi:pre-mRNA-splicing factor CWC25 homolog [Mizuhopecten yessoensis]|uniref:Pre-mRNA-splicing factor CWC25-like n=1 Tax=Mizuhopecten yessoensis TaxID=6573 RepID=A0A210PHE3_MIZYE|nr:pre-mRNA-splicing factor CWC25 homolog [Mizuhopecten yessoensis]OWF35887.1 Pre-mRNA-splicing factor CWC25-like [Mizuhopecten yessoensis]